MKQPKIDSYKSARRRHPEDVSMPETARPIQRRNERAQEPSAATERVNGGTERVDRTVTNSGETSVLEEMHQGVGDTNRRPTERYSFEIYTDQKQAIRDVFFKLKGNHVTEL